MCGLNFVKYLQNQILVLYRERKCSVFKIVNHALFSKIAECYRSVLNKYNSTSKSIYSTKIKDVLTAFNCVLTTLSIIILI